MIKVLIVEDNLPQRKILSSFLSSSSIDVTEAINGLVAYGLVLENKYDVIISDINMPEMDGLEFFELIHSIGKLDGVRFYFSSTEVLSDDKMDELSLLGMSGYMVKPFSKSIVLEMIGEG